MHRLCLFNTAFNSHLHRRFLPQIPKQYPHGIIMDKNLNRCFLDFSVKQYYTIISGVVDTAHSRPGTAKQVGWVALRCRRKTGSSEAETPGVCIQRCDRRGTWATSHWTLPWTGGWRLASRLWKRPRQWYISKARAPSTYWKETCKLQKRKQRGRNHHHNKKTFTHLWFILKSPCKKWTLFWK